jgi:hypothetical protein
VYAGSQFIGLAGMLICGTPAPTKTPTDLGGLAGVDQSQTGHIREQGSEPIGERQVLNLERQADRASVALAQVLGLSAIVSGISFVSPARRSPSVTAWPTLSGPSARRSDRT